MKNIAIYFVAVLLVAGILFGVAGNTTPQAQAAGITEGSYPAPTLHPSAPSMIPGEGSYPSPACSPQNPKCGGTGTNIAGEGSYPSPACSPQNPKCGGAGTTIALLGDGAAPMPLRAPVGVLQ
jgi:hypothetical protein